MIDEYYIIDADEEKGPFALSQLKAMWRSGAVTARTLYAQEGASEWLPLSSLMREIEPTPQQSFAQPAVADPQMMFHLQEKNPAIAAVLNLFVPGIGYMYCGRIGLGLLALFLIPFVVYVTHGIALLITVPVVVIDGILCAQRYNRMLADRLLGNKKPPK